MCFYFKGVNLKSINSLNKLIKKDVLYFKSSNLNSIYLLCKDLDCKDFNLRSIHIKYPVLISIETDLDLDAFDEVFIDFKLLSECIVKHNSRIKMAPKNHSLKDKESYLIWRGFNTPSPKDVTITPLDNTLYKDKNSIDPLDLYINWKVSSFMLIKEYYILIKCKLYMESLISNTPLLEDKSEYELAYNYWKKRQFIITNLYTEINVNDSIYLNNYIKDFSNENILYREICEDIVYVMLNILLAKSIIDNINIKDYTNKNEEFKSKLQYIIEDHYIKNKEGYKCLKDLRLYSCRHHCSLYGLKQYKDNI